MQTARMIQRMAVISRSLGRKIDKDRKNSESIKTENSHFLFSKRSIKKNKQKSQNRKIFEIFEIDFWIFVINWICSESKLSCSRKEEYELINWFINWDFEIQLIYEATASLHQNISGYESSWESDRCSLRECYTFVGQIIVWKTPFCDGTSDFFFVWFFLFYSILKLRINFSDCVKVYLHFVRRRPCPDPAGNTPDSKPSATAGPPAPLGLAGIGFPVQSVNCFIHYLHFSTSCLFQL